METGPGARAARRCLPGWRVEVWALAGSPSRKFRRWEVRGCEDLEQSVAGAVAGLARS